MSPEQERTLALAAVFQAAAAVADLSKKGYCDEYAYQSLTNSLFVFDPQTTLDVYGGNIARLEAGLRTLSKLSEKQLNQDFADITRYALNILALQKHVSKQQDMLKVIHSRLNHIQYKNAHFSNNDSQQDVDASLSGLYQDTISTLKPRIHVTGNMQYLTDTAISDKIRSMLFAGIRSGILWRQLGGTKWQLLFGRGKIEQQCNELLKNIHTTH